MLIQPSILTGKYADLLRHACSVLCRVPPDVIESVSVTLAMVSSEEVLPVARLAERLAEEYDLAAQTEFESSGLTALFYRRPGIQSI